PSGLSARAEAGATRSSDRNRELAVLTSHAWTSDRLLHAANVRPFAETVSARTPPSQWPTRCKSLVETGSGAAAAGLTVGGSPTVHCGCQVMADGSRRFAVRRARSRRPA